MFITNNSLPVTALQQGIAKFDVVALNLDMHFWDQEDEWIHQTSGIEVDMIYRDTQWIEMQL